MTFKLSDHAIAKMAEYGVPGYMQGGLAWTTWSSRTS